ncbi:unnamed protein product [Trichobilharzia regenti]|nr:unnamed protein product [Trichobilharzia regenti]
MWKPCLLDLGPYMHSNGLIDYILDCIMPYAQHGVHISRPPCLALLISDVYVRGMKVNFANKTAYVAGTDCLAGGTTSLLTCVRNFWLEVMYDKTDPEPSIPKEWTGLGYALAAASTRPARVLRLYSKGVATNTTTPKTLSISESHLGIGALAPGCSADFIIIRPITCTTSLKPELKLLCTWINGKPVYLTLEHETYIKMKSCI